MLPSASAYLLLNFSPDKRYLYVGNDYRLFEIKIILLFTKTAYLQISREREKTFFCRRRALKASDHHTLDDLLLRYNELKKTLIKTPIISDDDFLKIVSAQEREYSAILEELENFCSFFTFELDRFVNAPQTAGNVRLTSDEGLDPAADAAGGAKKGAKKGDDKKPAAAAAAAKRGAAKDELGAYESPLGATRGGIESLVLLLDTALFPFPFESLRVLADVPALSRDFSLLQLGKRYKTLGFKPELNNCQNINKQALRYVAYNFKKAENLDADAVLQKQSIKIEGVSSAQRVCSVGEWQKLIGNAQLLLYYGHPPLLNVLSPKLLLDMAETASQLKAFILFDKINARKQLIEKYSSLEPDSIKTPLLEQFTDSAALLTAIGCASICQTQYGVEPEQFPVMLDSLLKSLTGELYFAAALKKYKVNGTILVILYSI